MPKPDLQEPPVIICEDCGHEEPHVCPIGREPDYDAPSFQERCEQARRMKHGR